jgi:alcohol dehydrogenase
MKALQMSKRGLVLRDLERPILQKGEALLKVSKAGICGTDLAIACGDYRLPNPIVLGHEIFANVVSGGNGRFRPGTRVTTEINVNCGNCSLCIAGLGNHCSKIQTIGITRNGGFEEYFSVPYANLHKIPDSISDEQAVFVEPLAAAIQLTKMASIKPGSTCAIVGTGRLGLLILQVLKLKNPKILVAVVHKKRNRKKRYLAKSFGADKIFFSDDDPEFVIRETNSIGFDHVVEASGRCEGLDLAMKIVRPRGTIHVKSTHGLPVRFDATQVAVREIRIQGSRCGPFNEAISMLKDGRIRTSELDSGHFRLENFSQAFAEAADSDSIKIIFNI